MASQLLAQHASDLTASLIAIAISDLLRLSLRLTGVRLNSLDLTGTHFGKRETLARKG